LAEHSSSCRHGRRHARWPRVARAIHAGKAAVIGGQRTRGGSSGAPTLVRVGGDRCAWLSHSSSCQHGPAARGEGDWARDNPVRSQRDDRVPVRGGEAAIARTLVHVGGNTCARLADRTSSWRHCPSARGEGRAGHGNDPRRPQRSDRVPSAPWGGSNWVPSQPCPLVDVGVEQVSRSSAPTGPNTSAARPVLVMPRGLHATSVEGARDDPRWLRRLCSGCLALWGCSRRPRSSTPSVTVTPVS
jgi:hypothetical protein